MGAIVTSSTPAPTTPTASAYPQWETDLINAMGFANTPTVYQALNLWAASEGVAATSNNPLAVCCHPAGSSGCIAQCGSSSPIYSYGTRAAGVAATAAFLNGSGYASIRAALSSPSATLGSIFQAINQSGWCRGCQGGNYPEALAAAAGGNGPAGIFRGGGSGGGSGGAGAGQQVAPSGGVGCSTGSQGIDILGAHLFTQCQVKALVGGLLIGAGAGFLLVGASILGAAALKGTGAGRAVAQAVPAPARQVARRVTGGSRRAGSAARATPRQVRRTEAQRHAQRVEMEQVRGSERVRLEQERGSQRRATARTAGTTATTATSQATAERRRAEGFTGENSPGFQRRADARNARADRRVADLTRAS